MFLEVAERVWDGQEHQWQARRYVCRVLRCLDKKFQKTVNMDCLPLTVFLTPGTGYDNVQYKSLLPAVYKVSHGTSCMLSVITNKLKSSNLSCYRKRQKHLVKQTPSSTGSCTCENRRPVLATWRSLTARSCSWSTVQSRGDWYAQHMVLHSWRAIGNHMLDAAWWHWCLCPAT